MFLAVHFGVEVGVGRSACGKSWDMRWVEGMMGLKYAIVGTFYDCMS